MKLTCLKPRLAQATKSGWTRTASSSDRGYGAAWAKLRKQILERDRGLCVPCSRLGRVTLGSTVDHIVNKARAVAEGWTPEQIDDPSNLQTICDSCHKAKTASESGYGRKP